MEEPSGTCITDRLQLKDKELRSVLHITLYSKDQQAITYISTPVTPVFPSRKRLKDPAFCTSFLTSVLVTQTCAAALSGGLGLHIIPARMFRTLAWPLLCIGGVDSGPSGLSRPKSSMASMQLGA